MPLIKRKNLYEIFISRRIGRIRCLSTIPTKDRENSTNCFSVQSYRLTDRIR